MLNKSYIPWVVSCVLVVLLVWSLGTRGEKPVVTERHTTDTLYRIVHDTTVLEKIAYKEKRVVDTTYIVVRDSIFVPVPISEYRFKEDGLFDITARGFDVSLSNVTVYPKTEYRTITNTVEKEVYRNSWNCFIGVGFWAFDREIVPTVNLLVKTQNKWVFGANIGYYNKRPIYGGSVNYKILGK